MDDSRLYLACLRAATKSSWGAVGILSTLATFLVPFAAKFLGFQDQNSVNTAILLAPMIAVAICMALVPLRESFRMYRELDERSTRERKELEVQIAVLQMVSRHEDDAEKQRISSGLKKLHELIDSGRMLVTRMIQTGARYQVSQGTRSEFPTYEIEELKWRQNVQDCLRIFGTPSEEVRFVETASKESDWADYPDILHNPHKTLAANIDKRRKFLCDEILTKYGDVQ